jgi:two-component system, OmpR family, alkaline phosphatase synthesis response regulator PhoP
LGEGKAGRAVKQTILVVDDEPSIRDVVTAYLKREGFAVVTAADGPAALVAARRARPSLVILDLMLPGLDGIEVCRRLRTESDVPIIMLTARAEEADKLVGLAIGADDYVTKPFSARELVARVKVVLRRVGRGLAQGRDPIRCGEFVIDPEQRLVIRRGEPIELTALQFDLLSTLARRPGRVFTRDELIAACWGPDAEVLGRVVDMQIVNLRRQLEDDPSKPVYLHTVRGVGYRFGTPVGSLPGPAGRDTQAEVP